MSFVRPLDEVTPAHLATAGPLAVDLGETIRAGLPTPPGLVLTTREPVGDLTDAILDAYHQLGRDSTVVVRCSAGFEWHAGRAVRGDSAVVERVLACRASEPRPHAVVLQRAVEPERSGIAFVDGERVMLQACYGLPSAITSGAVEPDTYLLDRQGPRLVRMCLRLQTHKMVRMPDGSETAQPLAAEEADSRALADSEAIGLAELAIGVGRHYRGGREVEWAIDGEGFWVLRSRALRSWPVEDVSGRTIARPRRPLIMITDYAAQTSGLASEPGAGAAPR